MVIYISILYIHLFSFPAKERKKKTFSGSKWKKAKENGITYQETELEALIELRTSRL